MQLNILNNYALKGGRSGLNFIGEKLNSDCMIFSQIYREMYNFFKVIAEICNYFSDTKKCIFYFNVDKKCITKKCKFAMSSIFDKFLKSKLKFYHKYL